MMNAHVYIVWTLKGGTERMKHSRIDRSRTMLHLALREQWKAGVPVEKLEGHIIRAKDLHDAGEVFMTTKASINERGRLVFDDKEVGEG